jgi:isopenicillin N synthase-like dioxygenase
MYNIFKFIPALQRTHPDIVNQHRAEIEKFQRVIAEDIVQKLMTLISILLELPEDYLSQGHKYNDVSDCHLRYMIYRARSPEENEKYRNIYTNGHTDFGSLTLLFRQPIAALQIKMPDGSWKYVKPYPESITVNIADVLQFWTNGELNHLTNEHSASRRRLLTISFSSGYLKSSIHRVVAPPPDQAHLDRLGLLYFLRLVILSKTYTAHPTDGKQQACTRPAVEDR